MDVTQLSARLIPGRCCLCQQFACHAQASLCSACEHSLVFPEYQCRRCALPTAGESSRCGTCLQLPPAFDRAFSAFAYEPPISNLILRLKQGDDLSAIPPLARLFSQQLQRRQAEELDQIDALVPMPLHWRRQMARGFNQSLDIGRLVARNLGLALERTALQRTRPTHSQQSLNRKSRLRNLANCFAAVNWVEGKTLAVFDDVITTGATMETAARALKDAGAERVFAWSLARTDKPG